MTIVPSETPWERRGISLEQFEEDQIAEAIAKRANRRAAGDERLSNWDRELLRHVGGLNSSGNRFWAEREFALDLSCSPSTARRAATRLERLGYLQIDRGTGSRPNGYVVLDPAEVG